MIYVWLDALANYITSIGYPDEKAEMFKAFWPEALHVVGKDILRFHAVYWPAFLMSAGLTPPRRVFAHGWWTIAGEKMSKSLGNAVAPEELVSAYGVDATRWFLLREVPFGNDGNFSRAALVARVNADLANNIGNLAQRTLTQVQKNCGGRVPSGAALAKEDKDIMERGRKLASAVRAHLEAQLLHDALGAIVAFAGSLNEYIDRQAPWKLKKENPARMEAVLYTVLEGLRCLALLLQPFAPIGAAKLLNLLNIQPENWTLAHLPSALVPGAPLPPPEPIFPRLEMA